MKLYINLIIILLIIVGLSACCKAIISYTTAFKNYTEDDIELRYYAGGINFQSVDVKKSSGTELPGSQLMASDSILVFVNNELSEVHYPQKFFNSASNAKAVHYSDPRSLFNENNWTIEKNELKCNGNSTKATYAFR